MSQNIKEVTTETSNFAFDFLPSAPDLSAAFNKPVPFVMKVDVNDLNLTDDQFARIEKANPEWRIELNGRGELVFIPSTGFIGGVKNNELSFQISLWARNDGRGVVGDSSTLYVLPNGAKRSPDVSWVLLARLKDLSEKQLQKPAPFAPDFVIELRSPSDSLAELREKMTEYVENGVQLGWLIDPSKRRVYIYRQRRKVEILENPATLSGENVLNNFSLDLSEIWTTTIA